MPERLKLRWLNGVSSGFFIWPDDESSDGWTVLLRDGSDLGQPLGDTVSGDLLKFALKRQRDDPWLMGTNRTASVAGVLFRGHLFAVHGSVVKKLAEREAGVVLSDVLAAIRTHPRAAEAVENADIVAALEALRSPSPSALQPARRATTRAMRQEVYDRDGGRCVACGSAFDLQYDHIIPLARGGSHTAQNLQLLCSACNQRKATTIG